MGVKVGGFWLLFLIALCSMSCMTNRTLEEYHLGNGRVVRVTSGVPEISLPIYYEFYVNGELIDTTAMTYTSTEYNEFKKLSFKLILDRSGTIYAITQTAPRIETLAIFDTADDFRYPGCDLKMMKMNCECCGSEMENACRKRYNQLAEILERDNAGLMIRRMEMRNY